MAAKTPLNSLLAGALEAAKRGFRVHPGHPDSKKPMDKKGYDKRETNWGMVDRESRLECCYRYRNRIWRYRARRGW